MITRNQVRENPELASQLVKGLADRTRENAARKAKEAKASEAAKVALIKEESATPAESLLQREVKKLEEKFPLVMNLTYQTAAKVKGGVSAALVIVPSAASKLSSLAQHISLPSVSSVKKKARVYVLVVTEKLALTSQKVKELVGAISNALKQYFAKKEVNSKKKRVRFAEGDKLEKVKLIPSRKHPEFLAEQRRIHAQVGLDK